MKIVIDTNNLCSKRRDFIDAIVGVAMGMGYCPGIFGWKTNPNLTQLDCDNDNCIRCWRYAQNMALERDMREEN